MSSPSLMTDRLMPQSSAFRIRFALVGIVAILALGFFLSPSFAQPGRPRPPKPPLRPTPSRTVWCCSGCKAILGRGPIKPSLASCPKCGAKFVNGTGGAGFTSMPDPDDNPTGADAPAASPPGEPTAPPLPTNPAANSGTPTQPITTAPASSPTPEPQPTPEKTAPGPSNPVPSMSPDVQSTSSDESPSSSSGGSGSRTIKIAVITTGVLFMLGGLAILGVVAVKARAAKPTKRLTRRKVQDEED